MDGVRYTGVPSAEELRNCPGIPSEGRKKKGRVACVECVQEIPCNPCEGICPFHAITVGEQITALPRLHEEVCTGCGLCVPTALVWPSLLWTSPCRRRRGAWISPLSICPCPRGVTWWRR